MEYAEERLISLAETMAAALDNVAQAQIETLAILQSALGLREGLRAPDDAEAVTHFIDGTPVKGAS